MSPIARSGAGRRPAAPALDDNGRVESRERRRSLSPALPTAGGAPARRFARHAGDAAAGLCAVGGALWSWSAIDGHPLTLQYLRDHAAWFALAGVWLLLLQPASTRGPVFADPDTATVVTRAVAAGIGLYMVLYFLAPRDLLPRLVVLHFLALAGVATLAWRVAYRHLFGDDARESPVAVVGGGRAARDVAMVLRERAPHKKVLGLFPSRDPGATGSRGGAADLQRLVTRRQVTALILAPEGPMGADVLRTVVGARERDIDVLSVHAVYEQMLRRVPIRHSEPARVLESLTDARRRIRIGIPVRVKRAVDVVGAFAGCALLLVLLPVLGPLVWLDVRAPVFYRQERLGLAGRRFHVLKFRTMGPDAERDGPRWAEAGDTRASRFGRFLRRSRLDEIPQFWNVLRGEMSLVGPRPERPEFVDELAHRIPCYRERLLVRPGLSGWAQANNDYGGSVEGALDKLEYDLYYIKYWSLWFDAEIIWRTLWTVATLRGR